MYQRGGTHLARYLLVAVVALVACRDGAAQRRELEIEVVPDRVRSDPELQSVPIRYVMRSAVALELWDPLGPRVEAELSPGTWTTVGDPREGYVQPCPCGFTMAAGSSAERVIDRPLTPGRYRLRATYRRSDATNVTAPGPSLEALSNAFAVLP